MENNSIFVQPRKSEMDLHSIYFWTDTIKDWKNLLHQDNYKSIIINTLRELCEKNLIVVFGFVIMPNHLHLIWELKRMNGKEKPNASFNKKTSHLFRSDLIVNHSNVLPFFKVKEKEREYRFWQRDPLAILMDNKEKVEQKLDYIHLNPLQEKWNLAKNPEDYIWSSVKFYETGVDDFGIITHYMERF